MYKALDQETGNLFAVKRAVLDDGNEEDCAFRNQLEAELNICKGLCHPNIVRFLGHDYVEGNLYIYLEYVAGGSMSSVLREFGPLDRHLLRCCSHGVLKGLDYLHSQSLPVVHRDVKGANVLVDLGFNVKLADFGCSKRDYVTKSFTPMGSIPWMAPEVILQLDGHGRKADIWSLGCTIIEMASAEKPWGNKTFNNCMFAMHHIGHSSLSPASPESVSAEGRAFIHLCVTRDPNERPWTYTLLQHPFITGRH